MGDRLARIRDALSEMKILPGTMLTAVSGFYETRPVGYTEQEWFINAAARLETSLSPREVVEALLGIERKMGRVRTEKWGPRLIDLDLLFYDRLTIDEPGLAVPHPLMDQRRFVLVPLADVAPEWEHPVLGLTPGRMLARLPEAGQEVLKL